MNSLTISSEIVKNDSISVLPFLINSNSDVSGVQKILSISSAERAVKEARRQNNLKAEAIALLGASDSYIAYGQTRKAFSQLRKLIRLKIVEEDEVTIAHLYYNMAVIMARIKRYPVSLSCFYKAGNTIPKFSFVKKWRRLIAVDSTYGLIHSLEEPSDEQPETDEPDLFSDSTIEQALTEIDTMDLPEKIKAQQPVPIDPMSVINAFQDGKDAFAYAVVVHIKQPVAGKKKVFAQLGNVGHMFITLLKYNNDYTSVVKTFGFYPQHGAILSANPIFPVRPSLIKNDEGRNWDEMIGKFISEQKFKQIICFMEQNAKRKYNLNRFNCSDFALGIAELADIRIEETVGRWPLGKGKNPGNTGQSVLTGKFLNAETNSKSGLFACTNNLFAK